MKKKYIVKFGFVFLILLISEIILLTIVNLIPQKYIVSSVKEASRVLNKADGYSMLGNDKRFILDNWTDAVMINTAYSVDVDKPLESAMLMRRNYRKNANITLEKLDDEKNPILNLSETLSKKNNIYYEYSRYWHGYMIYLRPLLVILNYSQIRVLFTSIIIILSLLLMYITFKKIDLNTSIMTAFVLFISRFYFIGMSIQYVSTFMIMLLASLYIIFRYEKMDKYLCFFVIGCITCFFDLLTTPLITFGIPLIYYMILRKRDKNAVSVKETLKIISMWFLGYALMWGSKWIISDLLFNVGTIKRAFQKITLLTNSAGEAKITIIDSIIANINSLNQNFNISLFTTFFALLSIVCCFFNHKNIKNKISYIIIILLPFFWYVIVKNHSFIHAWFTCRNLLVSIFGLLVLLEENIKEYLRVDKKD